MSRWQFGPISILLSAALGGLFPIIGKLLGNTVPPLFVAGSSVLIATVPALAVVLYRRRDHLAALKPSWLWLSLQTLFIIVLPYACFYIGIQQTSGLHAALLLLAEIPFTVIMTPWFGEPTTRLKLIGSGLVVAGAVGMLWNQGFVSFSFNLGDLLIIIGTAFFPVGNFFSKKTLNHLSPEFTVLGRSLLGGVILLLLSAAFEVNQLNQFTPQQWWLLAANGLLIFGIGKIFWFEGFRTMDISKAIALVKTEPLFSLLLVATVLAESIMWYQWLGAAVMMVGVYVTLLRTSVPHEQTRYRS